MTAAGSCIEAFIVDSLNPYALTNQSAAKEANLLCTATWVMKPHNSQIESDISIVLETH